MMKQYNAHEYYFLDSFYMPILFLIILLLRLIPSPKRNKPFFFLLFFVITLGLFAAALPTIKIKNQKNNYANSVISHFQGSDMYLDSIGISRDAKMLALFSFPQNVPFIEMGRKGYSVMFYDSTIVNNAMNFDYDYVIVEDSIWVDQFSNWNNIFKQLDRIDGNGKISVFKYRDTVVNYSSNYLINVIKQ